MTRNPSDLDPFEREIREALAREAADPAPERLVARIARSRAEVRPSASGLAGLRAGFPNGLRAALALGAGLATVVGVAAFVVLVMAGGTLFRSPGPGTASIPVGASAAPSPSVPASAPATTPATTPSATPAPTPVLTSPPTAPAVTASPEVPGPAVGPVPSDFEPVSVTFVSASQGWVLGTTTCAGSPCAAIVRTTDGGLTWQRIPAPAAQIASSARVGSGVSGLRFGSALDGWAFGPDLWVTHDGGSTWHREALPGGGNSVQVMALEAAARVVHVAFYAGGGDTIAIASGPIDGDALHLAPTTVPVGAGPVPATQIVLHGSAGWLIQVDRDVVGGDRLAGGTWQSWQPPCLGTAGPAWLAASSASDLAAACDIGVWSTPQGVHLFTSADGGATFTQQAAAIPITGLTGIAVAPSHPTIVAAGSLASGGGALVATLDGGKTWAQVYTLRGATFTELGFTTAEQGVAIARMANGRSHLVMTRDGGRTWAPVTLAGG